MTHKSFPATSISTLSSIFLVFTACSGDMSGTDAGTGGSNATGAATGSGGQSDTGGQSATGGTTDGTGGATGGTGGGTGGATGGTGGGTGGATGGTGGGGTGGATGGTGSGGTGGATGGTGSLSYAADIEPLLTTECADCHTESPYSGGMNLSAGNGYDSLVDVPSSEENSDLDRVEPGDADASYIVHKLEGTGEGNQMPADGDPLSSEQIQMVRDWIDQGANP